MLREPVILCSWCWKGEVHGCVVILTNRTIPASEPYHSNPIPTNKQKTKKFLAPLLKTVVHLENHTDV